MVTLRDAFNVSQLVRDVAHAASHSIPPSDTDLLPAFAAVRSRALR